VLPVLPLERPFAIPAAHPAESRSHAAMMVSERVRKILDGYESDNPGPRQTLRAS